MSEIGAARSDRDRDTHVTPVLFRDGSDRRKSARIPLPTPVRIGPPNGTPYALVSAIDLSRNGLFIDADRPVRIGARFSAEIELSQTKVYIPEAEVAYNRDHYAGSGFGVRFLVADEGALAAVAEEIDRVTDQTLIVRNKRGISDLPTLIPIPSEEPAMGVELSHYPEPEIVYESLLEPMCPDTVPPQPQAPAVKERLQVGLHRARHRFLERAKSAPMIFRGLAIAGALGLVASAALALAGEGGETAAPVRDPSEHGVGATTHQVLMGEKDVAALDKPAPVEPPAIEPATIEDPKVRRRLLPPLVVLDEEKVQAKPEAKPKVTPKPEPKRAIPKRAALPLDAVVLEGVEPGVQVLKTHVFRAPDRFVIDLTGQTRALAIPAFRRPVKMIRTGRHPDFFRVVVDLESPIESGKATVTEGGLVIELVQ